MFEAMKGIFRHNPPAEPKSETPGYGGFDGVIVEGTPLREPEPGENPMSVYSEIRIYHKGADRPGGPCKTDVHW